MKKDYIAPEAECVIFASAENLANDWALWAIQDGEGYTPDTGGSDFGIDIDPGYGGETTPSVDPDGDL